MLIAFTALITSIYRKSLCKYVPKWIAYNFPKYLIIIAIVVNEGTMLSWRIDRENALEVVGLSYYFQWSPYNPTKSAQFEEEIAECPKGSYGI